MWTMNSSSISLKAYSKINLGLDVTGRRDDGYHLVRMIMQSVDIYDILTITSGADNKISFSCSDSSLETEDNLCVRAGKLIREKSGLDFGADIFLEKHNPVAAGMGGGSTDAAAVLKGLNELFSCGFSKDELLEMALFIGADVPFCIDGGCALCEGIGEELTPIKGLDMPILIARPDVHISTAGIYTRLDAITDYPHPDIDGMISSIKACDVKALGEKLGNVLELVTAAEVKTIPVIERVMMENGACGAKMTGSGPTVFGLFRDEDTLLHCKKVIEDMNLCSFIKDTRTVRSDDLDA